MTNEVAEKLDELKYMATRYQVVAVVNGKSITLGFTARRTRASLLNYCRIHLPKMITVDENTAVVWDKAMKRFNVEGQSVYVEFSGRTQRDCIVTGDM